MNRRVDPSTIERFVAALFEASGVPQADAQQAAAMVVLQEMRGVVTHGLRRVGPYLLGLEKGWMNPRPQVRVIRDHAAVALIEGDQALGMVACMAAMNQAIDRAGRFGVGLATVIHSNHFLSGAPYCLAAIERDMIGLVFSNTEASMGYPGALGRVIGNSPMAFGAPSDAGFPLVFDSSLTASLGRLHAYAREGRSIPDELYCLDAQGQRTHDPRQAADGGTSMPIGGHKGAGLGVMVEVLTGVLGGGAFLHAIHPPVHRTEPGHGESQTCLAINIEAFMEPATFKVRLKAFVDDLKASPLAPDAQAILLPGERAQRCLDQSRREGVILDPAVAEELAPWAQRLGCTTPW